MNDDEVSNKRLNLLRREPNVPCSLFPHCGPILAKFYRWSQQECCKPSSFTDRDGRFRVPEHPFLMLQAWTTFDGDRTPFIIPIRPTEGSMGAFAVNRSGPYTVQWTQTGKGHSAYRMIDHLPRPAQEIAWKYVGGRRK